MEEKVYFTPGDLVRLKQSEDLGSPTMIVVKKETLTYRQKDSENEYFKGIRCRWFSSDNKLQEAIFSTKDLVLIKKAQDYAY